MFSLYTQTPQFFNDICEEIRLFFPVKKIERRPDNHIPRTEEYFISHFFEYCTDNAVSRIKLFYNGQELLNTCENASIADSLPPLERKKHIKRLIKNNVYKCLKYYTNKYMPWGSLTGIRPVKLVRDLTEAFGLDAARKKFRQTFDVSKKKTDLAFNILKIQTPIFNSVTKNDIDIYINIPFCVSRCRYCSFIPHDFKRSDQFRNLYLDALKREITAFTSYLEDKNIRSVYIGGGTPTALSDNEFYKLMQLCKYFGDTPEMTVEAGRPDTITDIKLQIMKDFGVTRISINPQTLNQKTLNAIGRNHTVKQFYDAYTLAQKFGFKNINTDLILGLPGENSDDMLNSINGILKVNPQNITIHTLAFKRSSAFSELNSNHFCKPGIIEEIIQKTQNILADHNYFPYYLYRQKYMNGNLENTGYCKAGFECLYNIDNMEETLNILTFGAGSISKRLFNKEKRIERQANVKDVELYIKKVDEMIKRKQELFY